MNEQNKIGLPHLPEHCGLVKTDNMSLSEVRDFMTNQKPDALVRESILWIIGKWRKDPENAEPLFHLQLLLDSFRSLPRSDERCRKMNSFLRTLGQKEICATFLDIIRHAAMREGTREHALTQASRQSSKHAVYGWVGQTRLILSGTSPTRNMIVPEDGVQAFLGKTPTAAWSLSLHIWQPNEHAEGFVCGNGNDKNVIAEPPHSHPFDFASMLVVGTIHQSIYQQQEAAPASAKMDGRYAGVLLEHVHGVWPPHEGHEASKVVTVENRVEMTAGDSYFMSSETIHDVQVDVSEAQVTPAITLFLRSESYVKPHVYMAPAMADFHTTHPDLKNQGRPLTEEEWHNKLELVAGYMRGDTPDLNLSKIVKYDNEYAFFHI